MDQSAYADELERLNRQRLKVGWAVGAAIQLAFWAVDLAVMPAHRWTFLAIRVVLVGLGTVAVAIGLRSRSSRVFRAALHAAVFLMVAVVTVMTFVAGGFGAAYSFFVPAPLYAVAVLVAWSLADGALFVGASCGLYLVGNGLLLARGVGTPGEAVGGVLLVGSAGVFAFLTIVFADRARRAELALRADLVAANAALAARGEALQASLAELRERESRLAAIGGMTRAIVHDLRNPLAAILALSQSALEEVRAGGGSSEVEADLASVVASGRRLRAMLGEVLAFARGGAAPVRPERLEVASLVADAVAPLVPALRSAGVDVSLDLGAAAGAQVVADREALRRALENLVKNAAEAIGQRPGGTAERRGRVHLEAAAGEAVSIRVVDDGCGIPAALAATLFEPFASAGKPGGTGLGLMMARGTARAHGGDLVVDPAPAGGGAAFRLLLPVAPPEA